MVFLHSHIQVTHTQTHTPAFAKALVLIFEAVQPLGKEYNDHEEEEEHKGGHAHHYTHHLELCDCPITTRAFVPDVVLHIAPAYKGEQSGNMFIVHSYAIIQHVILQYLLFLLNQRFMLESFW